MWNKSVIAGLAVAIVGSAAILGWEALRPRLEEQQRVNTSDAMNSKGTILIGSDNFIGYYPVCSSHLRSLMQNEGYDVRCVDDAADYGKRFDKLNRGEIQFAVSTVDAYLLNGGATGFPGSIVAVIDQSQGADAILACTGKAKNIDDLKRQPDLTVAYTPKSPSEYLLKTSAIDFDIPHWRDVTKKSWRVEVGGSSEAAKKCASKAVDVAVLWEPDVTALLRKFPNDVVKILGTENTARLIVDVLIVRREYAQDNPEAVQALMRNYFKTLFYYRNDPAEAAADAAAYGRIDSEAIGSALKGVGWATLEENAALWLGLSVAGSQPQHGLIETIDRTNQILVEYGDFTKSPLPNNDPRVIVWSGFVDELYQHGVNNAVIDQKSADSLSHEFPELDEAAWTQLKEIGTLRVRPIMFQRGSGELSVSAKENIDRIADVVRSYPNFRILIEGHTSARGDPAVNLELSHERADAVTRYLMVTYGVRQNRIRAVGYGGTKPDKQHSEWPSRVVVKLVTEAY
ncbi:OmpA family protein [Candidatus Kaiserbacteria bacterium]|nr:OmpA family protein [Candidatus Kaiserbacteria bacterium]